jgi:hypothetical protein
MVKRVSLADLTAKSWRCFSTHHEKVFLTSQLWVPDCEVYGKGQRSHATSTLNKLRREHGGEQQSPDQKILPGNSHASGCRLEEKGPYRECLCGVTIKKDSSVMSQWAHHPGTWRVRPVAKAAQPAKQEEAGGWCPCLVWKTSQLCGAYGNGAVKS